MKRFFLVIFLSSPCFAVSLPSDQLVQDIKAASNNLDEATVRLNALKDNNWQETVVIGTTTVTLTLTPDQQNTLLTEYTIRKSRLTNLVNRLP